MKIDENEWEVKEWETENGKYCENDTDKTKWLKLRYWNQDKPRWTFALGSSFQ